MSTQWRRDDLKSCANRPYRSLHRVSVDNLASNRLNMHILTQNVAILRDFKVASRGSAGHGNVFPCWFLQLVGRDSADLCQQGWNSGTFFHCFGRSSSSTQAGLVSQPRTRPQTRLFPADTVTIHTSSCYLDGLTRVWRPFEGPIQLVADFYWRFFFNAL